MAPVRGLRFSPNILSFHFTPSVGVIARDLDNLGLAISSHRVPLERSIREVMIPSIRRNFDEEGRPPWEPLSWDTAYQRGEEHPILNRTGKLKRRATQLTRWTIGRHTASFRDLPQDVWYGKVHQAGYGNIPQRQFVVMHYEDEEKIEQVFAHWLDEKAIKVGKFR